MSGFLRNVIRVFSGTVFVNVFSYITLPLLTILYDPGVFGIYELLISLYAIFDGMSSFRYDAAIVVQGHNRKGDYMALLSAVVLLGFTVVLCGGIALGKEPLLRAWNAEAIGGYIWLVPLFVLLSGYRTILIQLAANAQDFKLFTTNTILLAVTQKGGTLLLGLFSPTFVSMCIAHLGSIILTSANLLRKYRIQWALWSPKRLWTLAVRNWKFPVFDTSNIFLNNLSLRLPAFMLTAYMGLEAVGLYAMADRLLDRPFKMLGSAISAVYFPTAVKTLETGSTAGLKSLYQKVLGYMAIALVPISIVSFALAPWFTENFLAPKWHETGHLVQILVFIKLFQVLNKPFSKNFLIFDKQGLNLIVTFCSICIRLGAMYMYRDSLESMLWAFSISGAAFYIVSNYLAYFIIDPKSTGTTQDI